MSSNENALPVNPMPECWTNDVRMDSLFAPFRLKNLNPIDWDSKMTFWCNLLEKWCDESGRPMFTLDEAKTAFRRKNQTPACLDTVIDEMKKTGSLRLKSDITTADQNSWMHWGIKQIFRPASWAVNALLSPISPSKSINVGSISVVHMASLKTRASKFLSCVPDDFKIGNMTNLRNLPNLEFDDETISLILNYLVSQRLAVVSMDGQTYKLAQNEHTKVADFTESELCLPQLMHTRKNLEMIINQIDKNIIECKNSAKLNISKGNKAMAMHHLKQKKNSENRLIKVSNNMDTIVGLIDTIKQTHTDAEVLNAYKQGLRALKTNMKQSGLEENNVLDTMDNLKEALEDYNVIEEALGQPLIPSLEDDELELEAELMDLISPVDKNGGDNSAATDDADETELLSLDFDNLNIKAKEAIENPATKKIPSSSKEQPNKIKILSSR